MLSRSGILGVDTEQNTAYRGFTYLVALLFLALFFSAVFRGRFQVVRELPRFATVGEPLDYRLCVHNLESREQRGLAVFEDLDFAYPTRAEFAAAREPGVRRNRIDEALEDYARAIALKPDYADAFYNRGIAQAKRLRFDEALASLDAVLALKPDDVSAIGNRGGVLCDLLRMDEALAEYERALALKPTLPTSSTITGSLC